MVYSAVAEAITFIVIAMLVGMYVKFVRRQKKDEVPAEIGDKYRHLYVGLFPALWRQNADKGGIRITGLRMARSRVWEKYLRRGRSLHRSARLLE
jgi:hypothetical protein